MRARVSRFFRQHIQRDINWLSARRLYDSILKSLLYHVSTRSSYRMGLYVTQYEISMFYHVSTSLRPYLSMIPLKSFWTYRVRIVIDRIACDTRGSSIFHLLQLFVQTNINHLLTKLLWNSIVWSSMEPHSIIYWADFNQKPIDLIFLTQLTLMLFSMRIY